MTKVLLEREGFRFVERGIIELNGKPDYRLQMQDYYSFLLIYYPVFGHTFVLYVEPIQQAPALQS